MHRFATASAAVLFAALSARAGEFTISGGSADRTNVVVKALVAVPAGTKNGPVSLVLVSAPKIAHQGQIADPGLLADVPKAPAGMVIKEVHLVQRGFTAGASQTYRLEFPAEDSPFAGPGFAWHDTKGESTELRFKNRPVLRYMYKAIDTSSKEAREQTFKVFHHLFDPAGTRIVTKGPGGQYTHHRGLFFGFNKVNYGEGGAKKADVWHCTGDAHQSHEKFLASESGPVMGRHTVEIAWHGPGKEVFAREVREITVYNFPHGHDPEAVLVEFASKVTSTVGKVRLDGDPQHAGFHFRADQEVSAKTKGETYYLRPDGTDKKGATRNWPAQKTHVNLPWNAMSFVLGGQRYTAAYIDKPTNPKEARFSERDYGRFGSYFEFDLDTDKPLVVNYRLWLQPGEMKGAQVADLSADFVTPLKAGASADK